MEKEHILIADVRNELDELASMIAVIGSAVFTRTKIEPQDSILRDIETCLSLALNHVKETYKKHDAGIQKQFKHLNLSD